MPLPSCPVRRSWHFPADALETSQRLYAATFARIQAHDDAVDANPTSSDGGRSGGRESGSDRVAGSLFWRLDPRAESAYRPAAFDINPYDGEIWAAIARVAGGNRRAFVTAAPAEGAPCWVPQSLGGLDSCVREDKVRFGLGLGLGLARRESTRWGAVRAVGWAPVGDGSG